MGLMVVPLTIDDGAVHVKHHVVAATTDALLTYTFVPSKIPTLHIWGGASTQVQDSTILWST